MPQDFPLRLDRYGNPISRPDIKTGIISSKAGQPPKDVIKEVPSINAVLNYIRDLSVPVRFPTSESVSVSDKPPSFSPFSTPEPQEPTSVQLEQQEPFGFDLPVGGRAVAESIPSALGLTMGSRGGFKGYALGRILGYPIRSSLQQTLPELLGEDRPFEERLPEEALTTGVDALLPIMARIPSAVNFTKNLIGRFLGDEATKEASKEALKVSVLRSWFKNKLTPEQQLALKADPGFQPTAGQVFKKRSFTFNPEIAEDIYGKEAKDIAVEAQQERFGKQFGDEIRRSTGYIRPPTQERIGQQANALARQESARTAQVVTNAFNEVRDEAQTAAKYFYVDPKTKVISEVPKIAFTKGTNKYQVVGPIRLKESAKFVNDTKDFLTNAYESLKATEPSVASNIQDILEKLDPFSVKRGVSKASLPGFQIRPWEELKDVRTNIGKVLRKTRQYDFNDKVLKEFSAALEKDIDTSVAGWSKTALPKLEKANKLNTERSAIFGEDVQTSIQEGFEYPSAFLDKATESTEAARRYARATGVQDATGKLVRANTNPQNAQYMKNFWERFGGEGKRFNAEAARKQLAIDESNGLVQQFMNSDLRTNLKYLITRGELSKEASDIGKMSMAMGGFGAAVKGAYKQVVGLLGANSFATHVLTNPKAVRLAMELSKTPAGPKARLLTKAFFTAAKITEINVKGKPMSVDEFLSEKD